MKTKQIIGLMAVNFLLGCNKTGASDVHQSSEQGDPFALFTKYAAVDGSRTECLGRHIFDTPSNIVWAVKSPIGGEIKFGFSDGLHDGKDWVGIGDVAIRVVEAVPKSDLNKYYEKHFAKQRVLLRELKERSEQKKRIIDELSRIKDDKDPAGLQSSIIGHKKDVENLTRRIKNASSTTGPYEIGLPDTRGYRDGDQYYAYLWRNGMLYQFISSQSEGGPDAKTRKAELDRMLKTFRPRKLHEIPKELGICFPYGFVPDNGRMTYRTKNSFRFADAPGVIYTLTLNTVGELGPEPATFNAAERAAAGIAGDLGTLGFNDKLSKRHGPTSVALGGLTAQQGGFALTFKEEGKEPVESYSIYTARAGVVGSQLYPDIILDLQALRRDQAEVLKTEPPPFDNTLKRLQSILDSMRLRETEPLLTEPVKQTN